MAQDPELEPEGPVVPLELGGKWIAWSLDGSQIIAHADTFEECEEAALRAGATEIRFEKAPRADRPMIGIVR